MASKLKKLLNHFIGYQNLQKYSKLLHIYKIIYLYEIKVIYLYFKNQTIYKKIYNIYKMIDFFYLIKCRIF